MNRYSKIKSLLFFILISLSFFQLNAQISIPTTSPYQSISHRIGITDITITYHSPAVKGRTIWGDLVPYGLSKGFSGFGSGNDFPWRAGANDNTTIEFPEPATINGKSIDAGKYGFHIIPGKEYFTLIFSKNNTSWGSFYYDKSEDVLRVESKPVKAEFREWLTYGFDNFTKNSAVAYLHWENLKIPFTIELDVEKIVVNHLRSQLRGKDGLTGSGYQVAAYYCVNNNVNLEEALSWAKIAAERIPSFNSKTFVARIMKKLGKTNEADKLMNSLLENGTQADINGFGYQLIRAGELNEAEKIFRLNLNRFPGSWNTYDSLAECLEIKKEYNEALKYYKKALELTNLESQKNRIQNKIVLLSKE